MITTYVNSRNPNRSTPHQQCVCVCGLPGPLKISSISGLAPFLPTTVFPAFPYNVLRETSKIFKSRPNRSSLVAQWVKDLALPLLWLRFNSWSKEFLYAEKKKNRWNSIITLAFQLPDLTGWTHSPWCLICSPIDSVLSHHLEANPEYFRVDH